MSTAALAYARPVLAVVVIVVAAGAGALAFMARSRPVPVSWVDSGTVLNRSEPHVYQGVVDRSDFAPCAAPGLMSVGLAAPGPYVASPGPVDRLVCDCPQAQKRYAFVQAAVSKLEGLRWRLMK